MRFKLQLFGIALVSVAALSLAGCGTSPDADQDSSGDSGTMDGHMDMDHSDGEHDQAAGDDQAMIEKGLAELSAEDRALAEQQKTCPVSGKPLGAMGKPLKIKVEDRDVFICCPACEDPIREDPEKYFAKLAGEN